MIWQLSKTTKVKKKITAAQKRASSRKAKKIYVGFHEWKAGQREVVPILQPPSLSV